MGGGLDGGGEVVVGVAVRPDDVLLVADDRLGVERGLGAEQPDPHRGTAGAQVLDREPVRRGRADGIDDRVELAVDAVGDVGCAEALGDGETLARQVAHDHFGGVLAAASSDTNPIVPVRGRRSACPVRGG